MSTPQLPMPGRQGATSASTAAPTETEADIMQAMPHELVRLLTGAVLVHLSGPAAASRAHLVAAHRTLTGDRVDLSGALLALRDGLGLAVRPDGIELRPETALLQVAYWLLVMETQAAELQRVVMAGPGARH